MRSDDVLQRLVKRRCRDLSLIRFHDAAGSLKHFSDTVAGRRGNEIDWSVIQE